MAGCAAGAAAPAGPHGPAEETGPAQETRAPGALPPADEALPAGTEVEDGLFRLYRTDGALRFGIPPGVLGRDLLLMVRSIEGGGGGPTRVLRWERSGEHLLLRERDYEAGAPEGSPIARAVERLNRGPIVARLPIEAVGRDSVLVVDVTPLFTTAVPEMGGLEALHPDRTFLERAWASETNVEVEATQTAAGGAGVAAGGTRTARLHWSLLLLPEEPMRPRLHDERVGFLSSSWIDYGSAAHEAERRRVIHRFRLEPVDPAAIEAGRLSDPVRPIVFWIDPATPGWLVPWVRRGVEAWRPAFEEAGFRDAIEARPAPTPEEDPEWSMQDARRSVVRWRASPIANATGAATVDPRSGEIVKGEVAVHHGVLRVLRDGYWARTGPLDPRNDSLPLPDSLVGRLVEHLVTHETGHALGLPHHPRASSAYSVDSLRSTTFLRRTGGHVASVMDYSRYHYVAQPEDGVPPALLVPEVGPYDRFAVRWGYRPIAEADNPEEERPTLERWIRVQDTVPWLRFGPETEADPGESGEAVGDADPVRASTLGLRNLRRVLEMLGPVVERSGGGRELAGELHDAATAQWTRLQRHVATVVGGFEPAGPGGRGPEPVSAARQREAVAFLVREAFEPPAVLLDPAVLRAVGPEGAVERVGEAQERVLRTLLAPARLERLVDREALRPPGADGYGVADLLDDLRPAVWREALHPGSPVGVHRRELQRGWLRTVDELLHPPGPTGVAPSDARPLLRGELDELAERVEAAAAGAPDRATRLHWRDVRAEIRRILEVPCTR